ncbi:hypothetical protein EVAR_10982_1 [Eumeta japonica]|uniref:Uncharacterized protein n=1 Tax=Eumeta variegata TaxID=151549 RepID=A0A4C1U609_EUMVA|nr:hypothetical protein EVAR_10982_1 [Eumeta japonica]
MLCIEGETAGGPAGGVGAVQPLGDVGAPPQYEFIVILQCVLGGGISQATITSTQGAPATVIRGRPSAPTTPAPPEAAELPPTTPIDARQP